MPRRRIILVARYYSIEPLGILYLAGLIRDCGWECKVILVKEFDFEPLYEVVRQWRPNFVGFQVWTGFHLQAFLACDQVRLMDVSVIIGGPHATYFSRECAVHADFVLQANSFKLLQELLAGRLEPGVHFNEEGRSDPFPLPDRDLVYSAYPELGASLIKSFFASIGCPMECTYCYAPVANEMHDGFRLFVRPPDELVVEAHAIIKRWPLELVYFQDDIFGYKPEWVEEFARKWSSEVGVPFHCQIRLEQTRHAAGDRRLDLFAKAGCTGITLAIESGNAFLRDRVLFRHMPEELIIEGCKKVTDRGMTLRTEQILAVPFSNLETELQTLGLNNQINPTMAWTSILAPYAGTDMGTIATGFGIYRGNNDDLSESFFDRTVLTHVAGGPRDIEPIVAALGVHPSVKAAHQPLNKMHVSQDVDSTTADVYYQGAKVGSIEYLTVEENKRYSDSIVRLQRLFNFLAKVPRAVELAKRLLALGDNAWSWSSIGQETLAHLRDYLPRETLEDHVHALAREMGLLSPAEFPEPIAQNPHYFCMFPAGGVLAQKVVDAGFFGPAYSTIELLDALATLSRRHVFHFGLYKIEEGPEPIAK